MRVLYITSGFPFPLTSGQLRHYHFLRLLSPEHRITLLSLTGGDFLPEHGGGVEPFVEEIETFATSTRRRTPIPRLVSRLRRIAGLGDAAAGRLALSAAARVERGSHDLAVIAGRRTAPAFSALEGRLPIVADLCDATSERLAGMRRFASPGRRTYLELSIASTRRVERMIMRGADLTVFASERDRALLVGERTDRRAVVIPNGVDNDFWRRGAVDLGRDEIVFTGRMDYGPNVDAAVYLVRGILPHVRRAVADVRVLIVGSDPTPSVRELGREPGVVVTGRVDDVRPYLERAAVFACPLRYGVGIQNKLLEAMAMELPVVSSSTAADGLRIGGLAPPIDVADDALPLAAALVQRLHAVRADPTPHRAGREFVVRQFSWERAGELLSTTVAEAAAGSRR